MTQTNVETTQTQDANTKEVATATLFDASTRQRFNPKVKEELHSLIRVQMRSGEGLQRKLFMLIRDCGDFSTAAGTIHGAEKQVCQEEKVKNLNQLNKAKDMALSSYITVKSALLSAIETSEELATAQQELYTWVAEHEGSEKVFLPDGYLDAFHKRYSDPVKGATQFRKDYMQAKQAAPTLQQKKLAYEKAQAKALQQATENGTTAPGPDGGIRSGGGQSETKLPETWTNGLNDLKQTLGSLGRKDEGPFQNSEFGKRIPICLEKCNNAIKQLYRDYHESIKVASSQHASRPSEAAAGRVQSEPELPEITEENEAARQGDTPLTAEEEAMIKELGEEKTA